MNNCIGIDVSKKDFHVCLLVRDCKSSIKIKGTTKFTNDLDGFTQLLKWVENHIKEDVFYVMEATGVYHEHLVHFLYDNDKRASVVLPNKIKHFAKSLNVKTKTDKIDATIIARYGLERTPDAWKPVSRNLGQMRSLSRQILSFKNKRSQAKCQLHALTTAKDTHHMVLDHQLSLINSLDGGIKQLEKEILRIAKLDKSFIEKVNEIANVKGLTHLTIIYLICETNGFALCQNSRQLVSYAGLDVVEYQSGTITGRTRISKRGNCRIRQMLYMPGMVAGHQPGTIGELYKRIVERNPTIKRKAIVAASRKLLVLVYALWKSGAKYNINHKHNSLTANTEK